MSRQALLRWQNDHPRIAVTIVLFIGYLLHLLYEVLKHIHAGKPLTLHEFLWLAGMASIVWVGAALAGWGIDLIFTKGEEEAGEID